MLYTDTSTQALHREIAARAAYVNTFDHHWEYDPEVGEVTCRLCGSWRRGTIGGCQAASYGYTFVGDCARLIRKDESNLVLIRQMVERAVPVIREEMEAFCRFPEGHDIDMAQDPTSGYYRSKLDKNTPCFFYQTTGFEFIYVPPFGGKFRSHDLDWRPAHYPGAGKTQVTYWLYLGAEPIYSVRLEEGLSADAVRSQAVLQFDRCPIDGHPHLPSEFRNYLSRAMVRL